MPLQEVGASGGSAGHPAAGIGPRAASSRSTVPTKGKSEQDAAGRGGCELLVGRPSLGWTTEVAATTVDACYSEVGVARAASMPSAVLAAVTLNVAAPG